MTRVHSELAFAIARPLRLRTVAVELDSVLIRVAQVKCFAHAMIGGTIEGNAGLDHATQRIAQSRARGIKDCQVIQTRGSCSGRRTAFALPGIQPDMVVVSAGRDECGRVAHALHDLESQHADVKAERAFKVRDLQMHMADACFWSNGHKLLDAGKRMARISGLGVAARSCDARTCVLRLPAHY